MHKISVIMIGIISMTAMQFSLVAQESVLPRPFEVYGGTIGTIDAIQVPGDTNKTRVFASTDSANSVFYADVDHSSPTPLGTNFIFRVIPDMDADANFGAPNWLAAHQQSGRVYVGLSNGLLSCTTSSGSLVTNINDPVDFVLVKNSHLFAVSDAVPENPRKLYYGTLNASGDLALGDGLGINFYGNFVSLAIDPVSNKVYLLCNQQASFTLYKSADDYDSFSSATVFTPVSLTGVTVPAVGQVAVGPDGRLFLGGGSSTLKVAWSDNDGSSWTNIDTGGLLAGGGSGLNIVCNGDTNAYEVYYGTVVSTNKGANGSWIGLPRPGGYRPPSMHVDAGCTKIDPNNSRFIYVTTDKGIGGSTNAGNDVVELNNGLLAFQINDIDALSDKSVAWLGSKAGMRYATNFNTTPVWADGNFPDAIVYACAIDSDDSSGLTGYAGSSRLYKTTTGGGSNESSWVQVFRWENYGLTDGEIRSVKAKGNFVALGYFSYAQNSPSGGVFVSSTAGTNWTAAITNINVNDMYIRDEGGTGIIYVAVSKSTTAERGGVYRIASSSVALDMTNDVNIRKIAEDSVGGIYASGTLPETSMPSRYHVVAYYRDTNSTWSMLATNGLPGDFSDGEVLGRGLGPVITVGKDSASNDVPVLAVMRTIYYLPYGGSSWVTITNYPNGTQIKTLFYDELMVGTTIGLYGQGLNAVPVSQTALIPLAADFDGDAKADPALYNTNGNWKIKLSIANYTLIPLTAFLGGSGYTALAADFDGDRKADPAIYNAALELWAVKLSSLDYLAPTIVQNFGGSGWQAIAEDFDGDAKADPALYQASTGTWKIMLSGANYLTITKPDFMGETGWTAIAADFDGDGKADPTIYKASTGSWIVMLSKAGYILAVLESGFLGSTGYIGLAADFDGDAKADPAVKSVNGNEWIVMFSAGGYIPISLTISFE